jgi:subtilisin family serine protease
MRYRNAALAGSVAVLLTASAAAASPAIATPATDGFWYFDLPNIQAAHDAGFTGEGVTIAVIDGQINLEVPTLQGADIEVQPTICFDPEGSPVPPTSTNILADHGTNIVSYLVGTGAGYPGQTGVKGIAPDAKVLFFSTGEDVEGGKVVCHDQDGTLFGDGDEEDPRGTAIFAAIDAGVDIISISLAGGANRQETLAIAYAMQAGIVVVAGVANDEFPVDGSYPYSYNGVVGVQSGDKNSVPQGDHIDPLTDVLGPGVNLVWQGDTGWEEQRYATGTSLATPVVAGFIALVSQKYPDATGNQLIQSLIRNTGVEDHELYFDPTGSVGYGSASATHMLRVDPTQYDDVNPLISDDPAAIPSVAAMQDLVEPENWRCWQVIDCLTAEETAAEGERLERDGAAADTFIAVLLAVLGGGLLLTAIIVTLIIVLVVRRSRRANATRTTPPA